jgi:hypothetical protein
MIAIERVESLRIDELSAFESEATKASSIMRILQPNGGAAY